MPAKEYDVTVIVRLEVRGEDQHHAATKAEELAALLFEQSPVHVLDIDAVFDGDALLCEECGREADGPSALHGPACSLNPANLVR